MLLFQRMPADGRKPRRRSPPTFESGRVGAALSLGCNRAYLSCEQGRSGQLARRYETPFWVSLRIGTIAQKSQIVQRYRGEWVRSRGLVAGRESRERPGTRD